MQTTRGVKAESARLGDHVCSVAGGAVWSANMEGGRWKLEGGR